MKNTLGLIGALGRFLLCAVFLAAIAGYAVPDVHSVAGLIAAKAAIGPTWAFLVATALLGLGSLSVIVGYKARLGASLLLVFLVLATYYFHGFNLWTLLSSEARHEQVIYLVGNLSMIGAMLLIIANGTGQMSFDARRR